MTYQAYKTCKSCDHDFTATEFEQECPRCGGETKSTPLFKSKEDWEELMKWQG